MQCVSGRAKFKSSLMGSKKPLPQGLARQPELMTGLPSGHCFTQTPVQGGNAACYPRSVDRGCHHRGWSGSASVGLGLQQPFPDRGSCTLATRWRCAPSHEKSPPAPGYTFSHSPPHCVQTLGAAGRMELRLPRRPRKSGSRTCTEVRHRLHAPRPWGLIVWYHPDT